GVPPVRRRRARGRLDAGRLPRRRGVLRRQRLPDHVAAPPPAPADRHGVAQAVLVPPRPPPPPCALGAARGRRRVLVAVPPPRDRQVARRRPRRAHVYEQLVADLRPPFVLRRGRTTVTAEAPLVARDRRAVLFDLAAAPGLRAAALEPQPRARGRDHRGA